MILSIIHGNTEPKIYISFVEYSMCCVFHIRYEFAELLLSIVATFPDNIFQIPNTTPPLPPLYNVVFTPEIAIDQSNNIRR